MSLLPKTFIVEQEIIDKIQELIDKGEGDTARLKHIKDSINAGKKLYKSDQNYLREIISKNYPAEQITKIEEKIPESTERETVPPLKKEPRKATDKIEKIKERKPVNVSWQIIMIFVPFVWIWAFSRIEKFWHGLALWALGLGIGFGIGFIFGIGEVLYEIEQFGDVLTEEVSEGTENLAFLVAFSISTILAAYFIRKWSIEWNEKISQSM